MQQVHSEGAKIVLFGSFNPSIFQPHWLGQLELIRKAEAENCTIAIIQDQVADFKTEWFRMQVLLNRFLVETLDATHYEPVKDLVAGIFRYLPHTPLTKLVIGRYFHYEMKNVEAWHEVGHALAPKKIWAHFMEKPGLRSTLIEGKRKGVESGTLLVSTQPSTVVENGVFVEVLEEHAAITTSVPVNAEWINAVLVKEWSSMMSYAEELGSNLLDRISDNAKLEEA